MILRYQLTERLPSHIGNPQRIKDLQKERRSGLKRCTQLSPNQLALRNRGGQSTRSGVNGRSGVR